MESYNKKISEQIESAVSKKKDYRPKFHIAPPVGLLNDPNGLVYFNGYYHIFYQWSPFGLNHNNKSWGHVKSKDMIHWEDGKSHVSLAPLNDYDIDGCYSGSAIVYNDELYAIYTGNVGHGEGPNKRKTSQQILAKYNEETEMFEKKGIVIKGVPIGYTPHFRDPSIFERDGRYYTLIGGQRRTKTGTSILYSSNNLEKWKRVGEVKIDTKKIGYMWECPETFKLSGKDIFMFSPQGVDQDGYKYQNDDISGYFVGIFDENKGKFDRFSDFTELDNGHEFYAPQTFRAPDGRQILIGWMGQPGYEEHPTIKEGWMHMLTIPRELSLDGNKIIQRPIVELEQLRKNELKYDDFVVEDEIWEREELVGDTYELIIDVDVSAKIFEVVLKSSVRIQYEKATQTLTLERQGAHPKYKESRSVVLGGPNDELKLEIFLDRSSIEIFINGGREVMTSRVFPKKDNRLIQLKVIEGFVEVNRLRKYEMQTDNKTTEEE